MGEVVEMVRYEKRDYLSFGFWVLAEGDGSERDMRKRDFFLRSIGFSEHREYRVISITFFFFFKCCADMENCGSFKSFGYIYNNNNNNNNNNFEF